MKMAPLKKVGRLGSTQQDTKSLKLNLQSLAEKTL